ncbi:MAG: DUF1622 domain-containing protein [Ignavibacteria bacterium]|nr:DUF1622 domain-containing protein [Ignavibacteria bacterium]
METTDLDKVIEFVALSIEVIAVIVIAGAILFNIFKVITNYNSKTPGFFKAYKDRIGKALQAGLEFLVAADIIRTVIIEPTVESVIILGILVLIRTFLSWSIIVESEERLPWKPKNNEQVTIINN